jgi:hypothetical protein
MDLNTRFVLKNILLGIFLFCIGNSFAQTGAIKIEIQNDDYDDTIPVDIRLYNTSDELIYKSNVNDEYTMSIDSIKAGSYTLKVFCKGIPGLIYNDVRVRADSIINFTCDLSNLDPVPSAINNKIKPFKENNPHNFISLFSQTFQPPFSSQKEIVENAYSHGIGFSQLWYLSNHYGLGEQVSASLGYERLERDQLKIFTGTFRKERYFNAKLSAAFVSRLVFKTHSLAHVTTNGENDNFAFIDLSFAYNFPVIYRYEAIAGYSKQTVTRITKYNDFSVKARLGLGVISLSAEFTLFDMIKSGFPETPRLMAGIEFLFPTDN